MVVVQFRFLVEFMVWWFLGEGKWNRVVPPPPPLIRVGLVAALHPPPGCSACAP